jgi:hypothetical protein
VQLDCNFCKLKSSPATEQKQECPMPPCFMLTQAVSAASSITRRESRAELQSLLIFISTPILSQVFYFDFFTNICSDDVIWIAQRILSGKGGYYIQKKKQKLLN